MPRATRLSQSQIDTAIKQYVERGVTPEASADTLGITPGCLMTQIAKRMLELDRQRLLSSTSDMDGGVNLVLLSTSGVNSSGDSSKDSTPVSTTRLVDEREASYTKLIEAAKAKKAQKEAAANIPVPVLSEAAARIPEDLRRKHCIPDDYPGYVMYSGPMSPVDRAYEDAEDELRMRGDR